MRSKVRPPEGFREDKTDPKIWYPTKKTLRENEALLKKMGAAHGIKVPLWAQWPKDKNKPHQKRYVAGSKPIFKDMKCHHWNGNMLVKEKECCHVFPRGYMAQTLVLGYEPDWTKVLKKHNGTTGFMGASLKGWKKGINKKILFRINIFGYPIELTKKI